MRRSIFAAVLLIGLLAAPAATAAPTTPHAFLTVAEAGIAKTDAAFWNPKLGWYDQRLSTAHANKPLASLWSVMPLFEAVDAVALADPTASNRAAVNRFVTGAERYYNPNLQPVGGYDPYPGDTNPKQHTYFDDNGWFEMSFLDAYRATGNPLALRDAERAFHFIAVSGWNPNGGGVWWETLHHYETAEPLAAEIYGGFALYRITGTRSYLTTATKFLDWANVHSWNATAQLYARNESDSTVLDYVEGLMIGAQVERCAIDHVHGRCAPAEKLAAAAANAFPGDVNWTPAADMIYLRFDLALYEEDGNAHWYDLVRANAENAFRNANSGGGLFFKRWGGELFPTRLLQPDAATLALFAWLGGA